MTDDFQNKMTDDIQNNNIKRVKTIVTRSENPHPLTIVFIIVLTILIMYNVYINIIKKTIEERWLDYNKNLYNIVHNKWNDTIVLNKKYPGTINGHLVTIHTNKGTKIGIWIDDKIKWMNDEVWYLS